MNDKLTTRWHSERLHESVGVVRWGRAGVPVLLFPTAGGDAEEVERFHLITVLRPLIEAGRARVYSCDSVAGRAWVYGEGSPRHRSWVQNQFHQFVRHELVPAIRRDGGDDSAEILATGASIGAFNALAVLCRFPEVFRGAVCMSGTYDLTRFLQADIDGDFYFSSPLHFLGGLEGPVLERLRTRFAVLPSGEGDYEDIGESWRMAHLLGLKGIPNRVDPWGPGWHHDWVTWREMLPQYLSALL